jgi:hypothetical protein
MCTKMYQITYSFKYNSSGDTPEPPRRGGEGGTGWRGQFMARWGSDETRHSLLLLILQFEHCLNSFLISTMAYSLHPKRSQQIRRTANRIKVFNGVHFATIDTCR